jgi:glycosyltransferase involved in cell wall biosynthesis
VNYVAPSDNTGYACAAAGYMQILREAGVQLRFQPLHPGPGLGLWYECSQLAEPLDPDAVTVLHTVPEYYAPLTQWLRKQGVYGPIIGMTVWETSRIPAHWPELLNAVGAVVVPSAWNRQVFRECGVSVPIFQVPHASQFSGAKADDRAVQSLRSRLPDLSKRFVFYSIGTWSHRKGNDLLVHAFRKAFAGRNDVALVIKTSHKSLDPPRSRGARGLRRLAGIQCLHQKVLQGKVPGITLLTDDLSEEEMRALHTIGNCYASCARGEGWALGLYEALLFENPVLAPREGGHREYLQDDAFEGFLPGASTCVRTPGRDDSYSSDQRWYEIDVAAAAQQMVRVVEDASQIRRAVQKQAAEIRINFGRAKIRTALLTSILEVTELQRSPS